MYWTIYCSSCWTVGYASFAVHISGENAYRKIWITISVYLSFWLFQKCDYVTHAHFGSGIVSSGSLGTDSDGPMWSCPKWNLGALMNPGGRNCGVQSGDTAMFSTISWRELERLWCRGCLSQGANLVFVANFVTRHYVWVSFAFQGRRTPLAAHSVEGPTTGILSL